MKNQIDKILPTKEAVEELLKDRIEPTQVKFYGKNDYEEFKKDYGEGSTLSAEALRLFNCPCDLQSKEECEICRDTDTMEKGAETVNE